jgi:hypothetical protein
MACTLNDDPRASYALALGGPMTEIATDRRN